jgi:hypothetical protein
MFKEIKIIEEYHQRPEPTKRQVIEINNAKGILGTEELNKLEAKFKFLISSTHQQFNCRKFSNVTIYVTTYLFSTTRTEVI